MRWVFVAASPRPMKLRNQYRWLGLVFCCTAIMTGEQPGNLPACANFRADVNLARVPVNVFDSRNRVVNHLDPKYFRVLEDGVEQPILAVGAEDTPASVKFVFDTSGSMGAKLDLSRRAVAEFLQSANPQDEFFLLPFDSRLGAPIGFTSRFEDILDRLALVKSWGTTALLDALQSAFLKIRNAHNPRRAIVIISDGGDNHSRATKTDIQRMAREADAQVYALGTYEPPVARHRSTEELTGPDLLNGISEQTGGRSFRVRRPSDIVDAAIRIGFELRNQYSIEYRPANQTWNGMYRRITVEVTPPAGFPQLRVNWRQGYYAAEPLCVLPTS